MSSTWWRVQGRSWRGGKKRQTLSSAQSVLPQGTVSSENKPIPPSPQESSAWDSPLLAAEVEESPQLVFTALVDTGTVSPKARGGRRASRNAGRPTEHHKGLVFHLSVSHCPCTMLQKPVPDITCRAQGCARTTIFTTSGKPADVHVLDFPDKGKLYLFAKAGRWV